MKSPMFLYQFRLPLLILLVIQLVISGCQEEKPVKKLPTKQADSKQETEKSDKNEKPKLKFIETPDTDSDFVPEAGFTSLTLTDFEVFSKDPKANEESPTWTEADGVIHCSGSPRGYIYSKEDFSNYVLRVELRFLPRVETPEDEKELLKHNTGVMIHIQDDHRTWPPSLEVQGKQLDMASIKSNGGIPNLVINDHPEKREQYRKPIGEWNAFEVVSIDGKLTAFLNEKLICKSEAGELTHGFIGFQAEDWPFRIRRLRIKSETE